MEPLLAEAPVSPAYEEIFQAAVAALDMESVTAKFQEQNEFIYIERFLPETAIAAMVEETRRLMPRAHRTRVPWVRKAGTIGQGPIAREAPLLHAFYRSSAFVDFTRRLTGKPLATKNQRDAHAAALYVYERPGDHVGFHYDVCGCAGQSSYTATIGLIDDSTSVVEFHLFKDHPTEKMRELALAAVPGSLFFFCGSKAYHRVTPLQKNQERVVYSFAYATPEKQVTGYRRFTENIKDAILYFGPKAIFQKNY
jgi:hypothetical protein